MIRTISRFAIVAVALSSIAACTSVETETRLSELEARVNRALQASAAAKVDAATAIMMAEEKK